VTSSCESGLYTGSGFLVGPQTMVTALHVVQDQDGTPCRSTARQDGTGRTARLMDYSAWSADDLAVVHLSAPLPGYYLTVASTPPHVGERVIGLGYSLANPLSLNQGTVARLTRINGIPYLLMNLFGGHGSSGGPILNLDGQALGLTQVGETDGAVGAIASIDLARLTDGGGAMCQGVAAKESVNTLCGSIK
jgi:serine protease Do